MQRWVFPAGETMRACTLGGDVKIICGLVYKCQIRDLSGKIKEFLAQGLDEVTRLLTVL